MCDPRHGRVTERRWSLKLVAEEEEEEEEEHWLQSAKTANATTKAFFRTVFRCVIVYYPFHNTPLGDLLQVS